MIETLSKMSGVRHKTYRDSKTVTKDVTSMMKMTANEGKVSYTMTTKEEPVISYNDMASIPPCNSIVFRAGDSPIWNRNETALPMSWRLFKNTIINPGKEYSLQTIPSLSTAKDFDVKQNQPNFMTMFEKRLNQAARAKKAMEYYRLVYGLSDDQLQKLDIDVYSDSIMELISMMNNPDVDLTVREENADPSVLDVDPEPTAYTKTAEKNDEVDKAIQTDPTIQKQANADKKIYAFGTISRSDLVTPYGVNHALDAIISDIYFKTFNSFSQDGMYFRVDQHDRTLSSPSGTVYIRRPDNEELAKRMQEASEDPDSRVHGAEGNIEDQVRNDYVVTDAFYKFLAGFPGEWPFTKGEFSRRMAGAQKNGNVTA